MAPRTRTTLAIAALAALTPLTACSDQDANAERTPTSTTASSATTTSTPTRDYQIVGGARLSGPGRWAMPAGDDTTAPLAVFSVPGGFAGRESFIWAEVDTFANITYGTPVRVFTDACANPKAPPSRVAPGARALADALSEVRIGTMTKPVSTELGGHPAYYFTRTVTPAQLTACKPGGEGVPLWESAVAGDIGTVEVDGTYDSWVVDVDGRVATITVLAQTGTPKEASAQLEQVVKGVTFVSGTR